MRHTVQYTGRCWRMKFLAEADDVLGPARAPEGRSHYNGQKALYLSTSKRGTIVASKRYVGQGDAPRAIFPLQVTDATVVDLRDDMAARALGIDTTYRGIEWQSLRERGLPSPTWDISDRVRELKLDGMLYASRSDPSILHLTLFQWNEMNTAHVAQSGAAEPWSPM